MLLIFSAIKTGRYTHEKRTRDIEEVKRLMGKEDKEPMCIDTPVSDSPCCKSIVKEEDIEVESIVELVVKASTHFDIHAKLVESKEDLFLKQQEYYVSNCAKSYFATVSLFSVWKYNMHALCARCCISKQGVSGGPVGEGALKLALDLHS